MLGLWDHNDRGWRTRLRGGLRALCCVVVGAQLSGCYFYGYFKRSPNAGTEAASSDASGVLGQPLGDFAGGENDAALAAVYAVTTTHAPAAVRPDPDLYARNLLRQYRSEGTTVAVQAGQVAPFSQLLGGASQDFATAPQQGYDATSVLAVAKVTETICRGLIAPDLDTYPGWSTILPNPASAEQANILWLAQRITGRPSAKIDSTTLAQLTAIMTAEEPYVTQNDWAQGNPFADYVKYVPVCSALALSADSLYF